LDSQRGYGHGQRQPIGRGRVSDGGIVSTLSGLFGKSDEERAREAAEQARRDEEAKKILELQANYQKNMLALQEAQAKLPFENLTRQLRLIDIKAQQQRVAGGNETQIQQQRLAARQAAISATLTSEAGTISNGELFAGTSGTPEDLTRFLSERASQSLAVAQFAALIQSSIADPNLPRDRMLEIIRQAKTYSGKIPAELYNSGVNGLLKWEKLISGNYSGNFQTDYAEAYNQLFASVNAAQSLASEITRDTGTAENLLSVIEQQLQTQSDIEKNTKATADNTAKALRPDRERSFIDVGRGFIQSLGQIITTPSAMSISAGLRNFSAPAEIGTATLTMGRARTLQERMADALERQVMQGAEANVILNDILEAALELVAVMDGKATTAGRFTDIDLANRMASVDRRRI